MINCGRCGGLFEPTAARWLCPHCGHKENCCEGAPLPDRRTEHGRHPEVGAPVSEFVRAGMERDRQAAEAFDEAERRIGQYIDQHRAALMSDGVRYAHLLDALVALRPPIDEENYLVKLSLLKRRKVLTWGATGFVRLSR